MVRIGLYTVFLGLFLTTHSFGQILNEKKFGAVPSQGRARLLERLNLYIEYERTHQYDKLFDLIPEEFIRGLNQGINKSNFVKGHQEADVKHPRAETIETKVLKVEKSRSKRHIDIYYIDVREKQRYMGRIVEQSSFYIAYLRNGEWYIYHQYVET